MKIVKGVVPCESAEEMRPIRLEIFQKALVLARKIFIGRLVIDTVADGESGTVEKCGKISRADVWLRAL